MLLNEAGTGAMTRWIRAFHNPAASRTGTLAACGVAPCRAERFALGRNRWTQPNMTAMCAWRRAEAEGGGARGPTAFRP